MPQEWQHYLPQTTPYNPYTIPIYTIVMALVISFWPLVVLCFQSPWHEANLNAQHQAAWCLPRNDFMGYVVHRRAILESGRHGINSKHLAMTKLGKVLATLLQVQNKYQKQHAWHVLHKNLQKQLKKRTRRPSVRAAGLIATRESTARYVTCHKHIIATQPTHTCSVQTHAQHRKPTEIQHE